MTCFGWWKPPHSKALVRRVVGRFGWSVHFGWLVGRSVDAEQLANEAHEARRSGVVVSLFRFDRLKSELIREPPSNNQKLICCFLFFLLLFRNPPGKVSGFLPLLVCLV